MGVAVNGISRRGAATAGRDGFGRVVVCTVAVTVLLTGCGSSGVPDVDPTGSGSTTAVSGGIGPGVSVSSSASPTATSSVGAGPPAGTSPPGSVSGLTETVVALAPGTADEASGIAASSSVPGAYFLVGDETGTDQLVAVSDDGAVIGRIGVDGMSADNAEALGSGDCGTTPLPEPESSSGQRCLYVGDFGDNAERRDSVVILRLAEPDLVTPPTDPVPSDEWTYTYPDGPQNAEALLVDGNGSLLIVTKPSDGKAHRIYRAEPGGGELTFVREFRPPEPRLPRRTLFTGNVVTDAVSAPGRVLLLTYDEVQQFTAPDPAADLANFPDWPSTRLPLPAVPQAEGITANDGQCGYTVASEAGPGGRAGALGIVRCD